MASTCSPSNGSPDVWARRWRTVAPGGPAGSSRSIRPSATSRSTGKRGHDLGDRRPTGPVIQVAAARQHGIRRHDGSGGVPGAPGVDGGQQVVEMDAHRRGCYATGRAVRSCSMSWDRRRPVIECRHEVLQHQAPDRPLPRRSAPRSLRSDRLTGHPHRPRHAHRRAVARGHQDRDLRPRLLLGRREGLLAACPAS